MNIEFDVNTDEVAKLGKRLDAIHRSAYPSAVRATLNTAAFDVKQRTLLQSAKENFVQRSANFFKANSTVVKATGWDVSGMKSRVGMFENKLQNKSSNYAVQDLEQQEHGGTIDKKSFIPMDTARTGKSNNRNVKKQNRLSQIQNIVRAKKSNGPTEAVRFKKAAIFAGVGGHVLSERGILYRVNKITRKGKNTDLLMTPLYNFKKNRSVKVKRTQFMEEAAMDTVKIIPRTFVKEAEFQFKKHLKL